MDCPRRPGVARIVSAGYFCSGLSNGCTQCENYAPDGQYRDT